MLLRAAAEVVWRDYCSFVHRPRPAVQHRKATESWVGPENDLRLLLSSLVHSLGMGTRLTAEAPEIRSVRIHATYTSSVYSDYISHKSKATTNQIVTLFPFILLLAAAPPSFMPCTACSGSPHNAIHSASHYLQATSRSSYTHISVLSFLQPFRALARAALPSGPMLLQ